MKVKLPFGHKAVISSLSKLIIKSKNFFTKVIYFGMLFENVSLKVKVKLSSGHTAVILSQAYLRFISGNFHTNIRHISRIYKAFLSLISAIHWAYKAYL